MRHEYVPKVLDFDAGVVLDEEENEEVQEEALKDESISKSLSRSHTPTLNYFHPQRSSHRETVEEPLLGGGEVKDIFKIVPVAMLTGPALGHMNWLKAYQDLEVCLVGDDDLTKGRTLCLQMLYEFSVAQMLYEFSIMSIEKPNMIPENEYTSEDPLCLSKFQKVTGQVLKCVLQNVLSSNKGKKLQRFVLTTVLLSYERRSHYMQSVIKRCG
ncbi:toll/interleukin-1 receptor (TIR) domain-containing protein [Artemisia annua]|uniref:Toll/interleukin-1 receptor (TIR) domain-containing protein n=1 Tax=Artemisia annua TaxID=35608 RepID=A0A2U1KXC5_ARTAN|nr:toll/interleukin-1 receptor (TIR) domain-containing protein [Artemisia annua]